MGRVGRPKKEIKKTDFEKLCSLQCTQQEICDFLGVDHKTLTRWCKREYKEDYSQIYKEKKSIGKISLRRMQFKLAEKSAAMAIFLGKNMLGQSDDPIVITSDTAIKNMQTIAALINNPAPDVEIENVITAAAEGDSDE